MKIKFLENQFSKQVSLVEFCPDWNTQIVGGGEETLYKNIILYVLM
jgi:hypothetical protein